MANDAQITEMVATWLVNESDTIEVDASGGGRQRIAERAADIARQKDLDELARFTTKVLRSSRSYSSAREVANELAPNDYDRIDWGEIAHQLTIE